MKLSDASSLAARILQELSPLCDICTIAGSIRRELPEVNDIDLVCVPKDFYTFRQRVLRNAEPILDGPVNLIVRLRNGVQLDIFCARRATRDLLDKRPSNYGSLLVCRTGSREHNIKLVEHAKTLGLKWKPYEGVFDQETGLLVASETEEQIFAALKLDYVEPKERR